MPGVDGLELCRRIRQKPEIAGTHIILLTGRDSHTDIVAGLDAGADDYVVKPFEIEELRARVHVGIRIATLQERMATHVAEQQAARDQLALLASTDTLTGLHSRGRWFERAAETFHRSQRYRRPLGVLMADLDLFKQVNDAYGHGVGDEVLKAFADNMQRQCRRSDMAGRLGGEEFAVLLPETPVLAASDVARRIVEQCRTIAIPTSAGNVTITCSIGVAEATAGDHTIEEVLARADAMLYEAKRNGRNRVEVDLKALEDKTLETREGAAPQRLM
jgi:two-component system chemotaxis response regulator CheY